MSNPNPKKPPPPTGATRKLHSEMCNPGIAQRLFMVDTVIRYPHFVGTGYDSELYASGHLIWAIDSSDAITRARVELAPPNVDPSLVSFIIEELKDI